MTNLQVIKAFLNKESGHSLHLTSTGDKLYSYSTVIAQHIDNDLFLNVTKYSRTTSKQTTQLKDNIVLGYFETLKNVPINTKDLSNYI